MKSLISVTPREFKRNFNEVMEMCTDMCMTTNQEIIITVPTSRKSNTHAEIAKVTPVNGGVKYASTTMNFLRSLVLTPITV